MTMRKVVYVLFVMVSFVCSLSAQVKEKSLKYPEKSEQCPSNYQLFPTENVWTLLKLDTRNGVISIVHFSINDDSLRCEGVVNGFPLVREEDQKVGRFTLYPTQNMYTFILLDKISGQTYQVQWSPKAKERFILPIPML